MADYIEREAVRNALYDADAITMKGVAILNKFPAADVAPVVHAHWIRTNNGKWRCSHCRGRHDYPMRYCGECGARMNERMLPDGEKEKQPR